MMMRWIKACAAGQNVAAKESDTRLRAAAAAEETALLASLGAVAGLLLAFYLTFVCSYASLSAGNLLVFLIMWLVPTPLISGMVNKY